MHQQYRETILRVVAAHGGLKSNILSLRVMAEINPTKWESRLYIEALDDLVIERELVEVNYIIPPTNGEKVIKIGQIYFPKGTKIGKEFIP